MLIAPQVELYAAHYRHGYESGAVPVAVTLKAALAPTTTLVFVGCEVMAGADAADTDKTAPLLVTLPPALLTITR